MTTFFVLAHLLVFVYWLGGDLGAFYSSRFVTDPRRTPAERMLALEILNGVDTAPAVALVLALPTGLALAVAKGWISLPPAAVALVAIAGLAWAWLAFLVHRGGGTRAALLARVDFVLRFLLIVALVTIGATRVARELGFKAAGPAVPLFIALKCLLLAVSTVLGLLIRRALKPFAAAFRELVTVGSSPDVEARVASSMAHCRALVLGIWSCLLAAALAGVTSSL